MKRSARKGRSFAMIVSSVMIVSRTEERKLRPGAERVLHEAESEVIVDVGVFVPARKADAVRVVGVEDHDLAFGGADRPRRPRRRAGRRAP